MRDFSHTWEHHEGSRTLTVKTSPDLVRFQFRSVNGLDWIDMTREQAEELRVFLASAS